MEALSYAVFRFQIREPGDIKPKNQFVIATDPDVALAKLVLYRNAIERAGLPKFDILGSPIVAIKEALY